MIHPGINVILCLVLAACSVESQEGNRNSKGLSASQFEWNYVFGRRDKEDKTIYTLMARGFMGMPFLGEPVFSDDLDEQISEWIHRHPKARVIPVVAMPLSEDAGFTYVLLLDGDDYLNIHLVRRGCCVAQNMQVTPEFGDLLISRKDYDAFDRALQEAESLAIKEGRGVWGLEQFEGESHWRQAQRLEEQGKFTKAIAQFKATLVDGYKDASAWLRIARCYDKLGQYEAALEAFDKSIDLDPSGLTSRSALIEKAECIARHEGPEEAAAVFGDVADKCAEDLETCLDLGSVHMSGGRSVAAVEVIEQGVQAFITRKGIRFDNGHFVLDELRVKKRGPYWQNVNSLAGALCALAHYCIAADDYEKGFRYGSMGLSAHQSVKTYIKDRYDPAIIEAGDFECRLSLARVFMQRSSFDEAKYEIDEAKILADVGYIQGAQVKTRLDQAYTDLQNRFPDRNVTVPPTYKAKTRRRVPPPTPEKLAASSEEDLIQMAAGNDPASSFAALEELVARDLRGGVSAAGLARLIADGLQRQQDVSKRWRAQYGVFIERAWGNGTLPTQSLSQYARHAIGPPKLTATYAAFDIDPVGDVRLVFLLEFEERSGGSLATRKDPSKAVRFSATVRLLNVTVDGQPYHLSPDKPVTWTWALRGGGRQGLRSRVKKTRDLVPGGHVLKVDGRIETRPGDLAMRNDEQVLAAIKPLATTDFSVSTEFEVGGSEPPSP